MSYSDVYSAIGDERVEILSAIDRVMHVDPPELSEKDLEKIASLLNQMYTLYKDFFSTAVASDKRNQYRMLEHLRGRL